MTTELLDHRSLIALKRCDGRRREKKGGASRAAHSTVTKHNSIQPLTCDFDDFEVLYFSFFFIYILLLFFEKNWAAFRASVGLAVLSRFYQKNREPARSFFLSPVFPSRID